MTLISAVRNVANECGYKVDLTVVGSLDPTTKQLLAIANRVIKEMADAYNWPKLRKHGSVTFASGTASYALPADFSHYHYETFWNQSDSFRLFGPMSVQEYAENIGFGDVTSPYDSFDIQGVTDTELLIYPTPDTGSNGQVVTFPYTSARPVRPRTWAVGQTVAAGEYSFANGVYYTANGAGTTSGASITADPIGFTVYNGAYEDFLADTDEPVLSQRILEQGMIERFAEPHGLTFSARFNEQLEDEYGKKLEGKVLYAGGECTTRYQHAFNGRVVFGG